MLPVTWGEFKLELKFSLDLKLQVRLKPRLKISDRPNGLKKPKKASLKVHVMKFEECQPELIKGHWNHALATMISLIETIWWL